MSQKLTPFKFVFELVQENSSYPFPAGGAMLGKNRPSLPLLPPKLIFYILGKKGSRDQLPSKPPHPAWQATLSKGERRGPLQSCYTAVAVGRYSPCNRPGVWYATRTQGFPPTRQACLCGNRRLPSFLKYLVPPMVVKDLAVIIPAHTNLLRLQSRKVIDWAIPGS